METLSNFASIYCYISFVIGAVIMLVALAIAAMGKDDEPRNKVRFFVARNINGELNLFLLKPQRNEKSMLWYCYSFSKQENGRFRWVSTRIAEEEFFKDLGLNPDDYKYLKWSDEPVEVFINLED